MMQPPSNAGPSFDRRVPEPLIEMLAPKGPLAPVAALVVAPEFTDRALDLQLRAMPIADDNPQSVGHATLYVGLTKALDVEVREHRRRFRAKVAVFEAGKKLKKPKIFAGTFDEAEGLAAEIVEGTRAAVRDVPSTYIEREGWVQALIGRGRPERFAAIDRESAVSFESATKEREILREAEASLTAPVYRDLAQAGHAWAKTPSKDAEVRGADPTAAPSFGGELDAIGIDARHRLLLIEVKNGRDWGGVAWTPLQVARYMYLFKRWVEPDPKRASAAINAMVGQRRRLGLLPPGEWGVEDPLELVPVIAVGGAIGDLDKANKRMELVRDAVDAVDSQLLRELEVWQLDRVGRYRDDVKVGALSGSPTDADRVSGQ